MNSAEIESTEWDYIVVGAGSAGCVIASRLSDNQANRVLLLEAGGSDKSIYIQMPAATYIKAIGNPKYDWCYATEPDPTRGGRSATLARGKVMGGSSSINGMIYIRGFPQDYDAWEAEGNPGWGWKDVLPLFKRQEDNQRGASRYHGAGGRLSVLSPFHFEWGEGRGEGQTQVLCLELPLTPALSPLKTRGEGVKRRELNRPAILPAGIRNSSARYRKGDNRTGTDHRDRPSAASCRSPRPGPK